jgi:hypothetical protein
MLKVRCSATRTTPFYSTHQQKIGARIHTVSYSCTHRHSLCCVRSCHDGTYICIYSLCIYTMLMSTGRRNTVACSFPGMRPRKKSRKSTRTHIQIYSSSLTHTIEQKQHTQTHTHQQRAFVFVVVAEAAERRLLYLYLLLQTQQQRVHSTIIYIYCVYIEVYQLPAV